LGKFAQDMAGFKLEVTDSGSYYATKVKSIASSSINTSSSHVLLEVDNMMTSIDTYSSVLGDCNSNMIANVKEYAAYTKGKVYLYDGDKNNSIKYLNESKYIADEINDIPGMLRALVHQSSINSEVVSEIDKTLDRVDKKNTNNPNLVSLVDKPHVYEQGVLNTYTNSHVVNDVLDTFSRHHIKAIDRKLETLS